MELIAKIIFYGGLWYVIGVFAMLYIRHWYNMGTPPTSPEYDRVTGREVFVLAFLGLGIVLFIIVAEIHYRLTGKG